MTPGFSVILPTFRRPEALTRCLEGISRLAYPRDCFEVIVVDDGGGLCLETELEQWRSQIDLTLVVQPNAGPAAARNRGARRAKFPLLAFLDDDCVPHESWLLAFGAALGRRPDLLAGGSTVNALPRNPFSSASQQLVSYVCGYYNGENGRTRLFTSNNMAVQTAAFHAIGGFDERFARAAGEDREFCDRWAAGGRPSLRVPEAVVFHAHEMTLRSFCRQHYNYGRGAAQFRAAGARRGGRPIKLEPLSFYLNLLRHPMTEGVSWQSLRSSLLLVLSQVAGAAGFYSALAQAARRRGMAPNERSQA